MALLLREKREAVLGRWVELTFRTYPAETSAFLGREHDRFRNPVGHATRESLRVLLDGLLEEEGKARRVTAEGGCATQDGVSCAATAEGGATQDRIEAMTSALDEIIRIRAVQKFTAAEAAGFPLLLKQAVAEITGEGDSAELLKFFEKIDRLALLAFDVYAQCREQLYQVRVNELLNRQAAPRSLQGKAGGCNSGDCSGCSNG